MGIVLFIVIVVCSGISMYYNNQQDKEIYVMMKVWEKQIEREKKLNRPD